MVFLAKDKIGFVTSAGGRLPKSVSNLDDKIQRISKYFRSLPVKTEVILNAELEKIKQTAITDNYLKDFMFMAKRGLYAFDKACLNNFSDTNYHLVASPVEFLKAKDLPPEIIDLISNTFYSGSIKAFINVDDVL